MSEYIIYRTQNLNEEGSYVVSNEHTRVVYAGDGTSFHVRPDGLLEIRWADEDMGNTRIPLSKLIVWQK